MSPDRPVGLKGKTADMPPEIGPAAGVIAAS